MKWFVAFGAFAVLAVALMIELNWNAGYVRHAVAAAAAWAIVEAVSSRKAAGDGGAVSPSGRHRKPT